MVVDNCDTSATCILDEHARIEEAIRNELITLVDILMDRDNHYLSKGEIERLISEEAHYSEWDPMILRFPQQWQSMQKILRSEDPAGQQVQQLKEIAVEGKLEVREKGQRYTLCIDKPVLRRLKQILSNGTEVKTNVKT